MSRIKSTQENQPLGLFATILSDVHAKSIWVYESERPKDLLKTLLTDGTTAMVIYRLMQWSRRWRLGLFEMVFNKCNSILCRCVIGRGAEFGPGLVLIHSDGIFINGAVRGGSGIKIEHQVTIGAESRKSPILGDDVFVGAGAKVIGAVLVGDCVRIGANAVVINDVPANCWAVGVPARVIHRKSLERTGLPGSGKTEHHEAVIPQ